MLEVVRAKSLDALIDETIPEPNRLTAPLDLPPGETEAGYLERLRRLAAGNRPTRTYIGLGYYGCVTPSVILRNVLENPGWYTPYTPYQAEVAQGRLEALLNFQTMVEDLTGMEVANASLLDEATAAAEAMTMLHRIRARRTGGANRFVVSDRCLPQTIEVVRGRAAPLGLDLEVGDLESIELDEATFGVLIQYPDADGAVEDPSGVVARARRAGAYVAVATDLLALTLLAPPGEWGADVAVGSAQRFGVPLGYGGPHPAFFATRQAHARQIPGRLIGVSADAHGRTAYRMALQTREQHIRRERATSNICTAQALLANIAGFYAVYHGPDGLSAIARRVHGLARRLARELAQLGVSLRHECYFDTLRVGVGSAAVQGRIRHAAETEGLNFPLRRRDGHRHRPRRDGRGPRDVERIASLFAAVLDKPRARRADDAGATADWPAALRRTSAFLTHPVFHRHQAETQMMRYLRQLERKDIGLDRSMIPLGSCTMKLNAATEMRPVTWPEFGAVHPFVPPGQVPGYHAVFAELEAALRTITGLDAVSLQPNSGAQGELAGLMVIRAWRRARGEHGRDVVLIPASAHGTNPASAAMAGMQVVIVACDDRGNVDAGDLEAKATAHAGRLNALMITYPSTHGVFEDRVREISDVVHARGGQVYMDGANMNAQVGLTSPAVIGARRMPPQPAQDVRHSARRRRARHGADRGRPAPGAVSSGPSGGLHGRCGGHSAGGGRAVGQREHHPDLARLRAPARPGGRHRGEPRRHPERQLHQVPAGTVLRRALRPAERARCTRADLRSASVPRRGGRHGARRGQAADRLRLPRADRVVSGGRHADGGADGERAARRAGPLLRCDGRDPR